jgi:hypothetical protein
MDAFSQYAAAEQVSRWRPVLIAVLIIVVVGVLTYVFSRGESAPANLPPATPAYASSVQVGDLHLSSAENFVGGRVTYLEGKATNTGDKTVTGAQIETIFRNSLGEVVDKQTQALRVAASPLGHPDWVALSVAPLAPGKSANFRLTFEHISADWNQGYPEMKFVNVETK